MKYTPKIKLIKTAAELGRVTLDMMPVGVVCRCHNGIGNDECLAFKVSTYSAHCVETNQPIEPSHLVVSERLDGQPLPTYTGPETWAEAVPGDCWQNEIGYIVWKVSQTVGVIIRPDAPGEYARLQISPDSDYPCQELGEYLGQLDPLNPCGRWEAAAETPDCVGNVLGGSGSAVRASEGVCDDE